MRTTSDWPIVVGIDGSPEASHALRYAVREAEREGEQGDLRIVAEQEGGQHLQPAVLLGRAVQGGHQRLARGARLATLGEACVDEGVEPVGLAHHQREGDDRARNHQNRRHHYLL